jgi:ribonuclease Z
VYSVKNKLKKEFLGLPSEKIKELKLSGVQITDTIRVPEVAFTGDTTPDFILDKANKDVLEAKLLIMEATFLDGSVTIEHARNYGHTHLFEVLILWWLIYGLFPSSDHLVGTYHVLLSSQRALFFYLQGRIV